MAKPGGSSSGGSGGSSSEPFSIGSQLLVLLSADSAALAVYSEGQLLRHKVHTGYTVRQQQGKAQATYERQGGGARSVGGSIRARETRRLFQAAAATLAGWEGDVAGCSLLFRSGSVRAWNELYAARSPPVPVDRRDPRWQPVGLSMRRPRLEDAERAFAALSTGTLWERLQ
ncbi:ankyrin repeat and zinc finger domain-containing 1-like [Chlorella sorokiniana]|uniref:Ankyrin repeat and zinc finger domain-containing 1-like n=1 Tax=Chlorella sorokiniana TaxID=3076 RepID=A0A2P6U043_CHLSO|nr:ankyrin repeat and zinc finger domain-containing 1-like [Chlorella sorokiniana]|eukprot:PRW59681.1 ankyrin repeat and zinc finger domain-containing 1-like [Chlorella sorokiniana]